MADRADYRIDVTITPYFGGAADVQYLRVSLRIDSSRVHKGDLLFSLPSKPECRTRITPADNEQWEGVDALGKLAVKFESVEGTGKAWFAARDTSGPLLFNYHVIPSSSTLTAFDLQHDQGGVLGSGLSFIPTPAGAENYIISLVWDLESAPDGTRALWTFGEGPGRIEVVGLTSILTKSVYMVGPIQGIPRDPSFPQRESCYGYYWFGSLPPNLEAIRDIHHDFLIKVSEFFNDLPSSSNPYRSFLRRSTDGVPGFGGTPLLRSHIFVYDDRIAEAEDYDLVRRLAYEITHVFLGPSSTDRDHVDWLFEGIKNTLSIYLPFRPPKQFRTGEYFQATINMLCVKYYTNPLVNFPHGDVCKLALEGNLDARDLLSARSWAFVMETDIAARKLVEQTKPPQRPIEDLAIKPLAVQKRNGQSYDIEDWISHLEPLMGSAARDRHQHMCSGKAIIIPPEVFGAKSHRMVSIEQEIFDLGMDRNAYHDGLVRGLKKGSRAEAAGLQENDSVVWSSYLWRCIEHFEAQLTLIVRRDGQDIQVKYWPRAYEKAPSWRMVKVAQP